MKPTFSAAWLLICLSVSVQPAPAIAASAQDESSNGSSQTQETTDTPVKTAEPAEKRAEMVKSRAPIAHKSKSASEVAKTRLPSAHLDLRLPRDMVQALKPVGTVPLSPREPLLPEMFGDKNSPFQLNGKLLNNEMQLQLRNEERREVDGALLEFEFKQ